MSSILNETTMPSETTMQQFTFNTIDYIVFVLMLFVSAGIGTYFGFFEKSADTTDEYLLGGKRMKTIPIAISLVASQLSGISIMTIPAEMYSFGINWAFNIVSIILVVPLLVYIIIPVFYNNNISNCYEYLELRFNRATREILTISFIAVLVFMLPVFIFIPALAFSQVTGLNIHLINTVVCMICIFYTMFGGIKAVVWTDVFQGVIMVISVVLVGILGCVKIGGIGEVLKIAKAGQRLDVDFTFDLTTRTTFWNCFTNSALLWASYVGLNQSCVQRIVSLPSLGHAKRALVLFGIGFFVIMFFNCFTGIVMYARYADCDPISAGFVSKPDKLMPHFVQDIVGHLNGMPGVFISCVFSAALSTISASLNSLSGIVYFDYIKPYINHTERKANLIMKLFVLVAGIYCILAGFIVEQFTSILHIVYTIGGITYGSVFGVFLMGMLVPKAHGKAAFISVVVCMLSMLIIIIGAQGKLIYQGLPVSTEACPEFNQTSSNANTSILVSTTNVAMQNVESTLNIFKVSINWYVVIGTIIVFIVGVPLSYILPPQANEKLNPKLLSSIIRSFCKYELAQQTDELPEIARKTNQI